MKILSVASEYSQQPEEKLITISRINGASCPFSYYKNYIERPKPKEAFETIEAGLGQFFHSFLETHFQAIHARNGTISRQDAINVADLIRDFRLSFMWGGKLRAPYRIVRDNHDMSDFVERLKTIGENFNSFLNDNLVGHRIIAIEGRLQIQTDSFYIRGIYDLLTRAPGGMLVLWDWKTGKIPNPRYYEAFLAQKIQLGIYAIWVKYKYETDNIGAVAAFLREDVDTLYEVFNPDVEQDVLDFVAKWRSHLNDLTSYPAKPSNLCDWCGWNPVCPAYKSSEAL